MDSFNGHSGSSPGSKVRYVDIGTLLAHPLNKKLYGNRLDKQFVISIRDLGQLEPIQIATFSLDGQSPKTYILSGHRRVLALKQLNQRLVKVIDADVDTSDPVKVEQLLIDFNRQRIRSWEERGREFKELWRIEIALAKQRQITSTGGNERQLREIFPQAGRAGKARDIAADKSSLNLSGRAAADFVRIIDAADAGDERARTALDAINANTKTISRAFKELYSK